MELMDAKAAWLTDSQQQTWRAFLRATQVLHESLDRQLRRDSGFPHAYYTILVVLSESPQRTMSMTDLASFTKFSASRLSHAISQLEKNGWVTRAKHPMSGRTTMATISQSGIDALSAAAPGHVRQVRAAVFDPLTAEEHRELGRLCQKLLDAGFDLE